MTAYCVGKNGNNLYRALVPTLKKGEYESKNFLCSKHMSSENMAIEWQNKRGIEIWGKERWELIASERSVRMFWGRRSVNVYFFDNTWSAFWREDGKPMSQKFANKQKAEQFARIKKIELAFKPRTYTN